MTHVSLFSGIGGIDLAAEWAGFRTIVQVERNRFCQRVLEKHWPGVHRVQDIRDFPDREYGAVTLVSGGFPCQPFSVAGKRRGTEDDRYLWPEMLRVIQAVKPRFVLAENVSGILAIESGMVFESVLADLEAEGYETWTGLIPAVGAGAPHYRYRVFVVGHAECSGRVWSQESGRETRQRTGDSSQDMADTEYLRELQSQGSKQNERGWISNSDWWAVEPDVGRVASRVPDGLDGGIDEILRILWEIYGETEMVKRKIGQYVGESSFLFQQMLWRLDYLTKQGKTEKWQKKSTKTSEESQLRNMWIENWFTKASQRPQSPEQLIIEYSSLMSEMSQRGSHERWNMGDLWFQEPNIPRVAKGIKDRVSRLKALGNAVVPQQVYPILKAIAEVEHETNQSQE